MCGSEVCEKCENAEDERKRRGIQQSVDVHPESPLVALLGALVQVGQHRAALHTVHSARIGHPHNSQQAAHRSANRAAVALPQVATGTQAPRRSTCKLNHCCNQILFADGLDTHF